MDLGLNLSSAESAQLLDAQGDCDIRNQNRVGFLLSFPLMDHEQTKDTQRKHLTIVRWHMPLCGAQTPRCQCGAQDAISSANHFASISFRVVTTIVDKSNAPMRNGCSWRSQWCHSGKVEMLHLTRHFRTNVIT